MIAPRPHSPGPARWGTPTARRVLITCVLGSSIAFLDATVVNVALPRIGTDLHTGLAGLQWVVDTYLVALSALVLVGGALGDHYGRRKVFIVGVCAFTVASVAAGISPSIGALLLARTLQGIAAALLVPSSLSLLTASIHPDDRARAVGAWSGLAGLAGALGPLVGGWLIDALSWRWVFFVNVPIAAAVVVVARKVPETIEEHHAGRIDWLGAGFAAAGLGLATAGAIEHGSTASPFLVAAGLLSIVLFVVTEARIDAPMLPLAMFRSRQFTGANIVTFAVYCAFGVATFLVVLNLQRGLGYSALEAGAALAPVTLMLLLLSSRVGVLAQRIGPAVPMTAGPLLSAAGLAWLSRLQPSDHYVTSVLPAVIILGLGMALMVAPLTSVVLQAVDDDHLGVASGANNAVARLASLSGVAIIPVFAGVHLSQPAGRGIAGYRGSLLIAAGLCAAGGVVSAVTVRRARTVRPSAPPSVLEPCGHPCRVEDAAA